MFAKRYLLFSIVFCIYKFCTRLHQMRYRCPHFLFGQRHSHSFRCRLPCFLSFSAAPFRRAGRACSFFRSAFVARFATSHKWFLAFSRCNSKSWRRLRAAQQGSVRREMSLKIFARLRRRREKRNENPKRSGRSGPHDQKSAAIHIICTFWMPKSLSRFQNRLHRLQPDSSRQDQRRLQRMWSQRTSPELSAA